jgi:small subunit ribosomal protein S4
MGFARSIRQARQMVNHAHFLVNGKKVDRPSYAIQIGDVVSLRERSRSLSIFKDNMASGSDHPYLHIDRENLEGTLMRLPAREELPIEINEQLIVEYYSR